MLPLSNFLYRVTNDLRMIISWLGEHSNRGSFGQLPVKGAFCLMWLCGYQFIRLVSFARLTDLFCITFPKAVRRLLSTPCLGMISDKGQQETLIFLILVFYIIRIPSFLMFSKFRKKVILKGTMIKNSCFMSLMFLKVFYIFILAYFVCKRDKKRHFAFDKCYYGII